MASSNNLASLDPWTFRSSAFPDSWISDAFARETETFTKALQQSISNGTDIFPDLVKNEPVFPTGSGVSDTDMYPKRRNNNNNNIGLNGRITKRKSRASKRSPTTFIAADPSNFRQMVQQVTGIQFGEEGNMQVLKPEPYRPGSGNRIQSFSLPTLDTSSVFLLDRNQSGNVVADRQEPPQLAADGGGGFDFGNFHTFPTLESWRVI